MSRTCLALGVPAADALALLPTPCLAQLRHGAQIGVLGAAQPVSWIPSCSPCSWHQFRGILAG